MKRKKSGSPIPIERGNEMRNTYCVRRVKAALVMLDGKCKPLIISCHNFLLITSTKPPRAITKLYSSYKSSTDLAIIGNRLMGVPKNKRDKKHIKKKEWNENRYIQISKSLAVQSHAIVLDFRLWLFLWNVPNVCKCYTRIWWAKQQQRQKNVRRCALNKCVNHLNVVNVDCVWLWFCCHHID